MSPERVLLQIDQVHEVHLKVPVLPVMVWLYLMKSCWQTQIWSVRHWLVQSLETIWKPLLPDFVNQLQRLALGSDGR